MRAFVAVFAAAAAFAVPLEGPAFAQAGVCDRACLEGFVERYLDALVAGDPSALPLARNVRFTENGQRLEVGDGLWRSVKEKGRYRLVVADAEAGQVAFIATLIEDHADPAQGVPALAAGRLRIVNGEVAEIEQMTARNVDAAERVEALGAPRPQFSRTLPQRERLSRAELIGVADKYFTGMQQNDGKGDYPFAETCERIENGRPATNVPTPPGEPRPDPATATGYSAQWSCLEQFESGLLHFVTRIRDRRYVAVDAERGLVFAFVFFDHAAGDTRRFTTPNGRTVAAGPAQPWTWYIAEVFSVDGGRLDQIEAVLERVPYGMLSGWSFWEEGMSDRARDETR